MKKAVIFVLVCFTLFLNSCASAGGEAGTGGLSERDKQCVARCAKEIREILERAYQQLMSGSGPLVERKDQLRTDFCDLQIELEYISPYYFVSEKIAEAADSDASMSEMRYAIQVLDKLDAPDPEHHSACWALLHYGERAYRTHWPDKYVTVYDEEGRPYASIDYHIPAADTLGIIVARYHLTLMDAVDALKDGFSSKSAFMRASCLYHLADCAPKEEAQSAVWRCLKDKDPRVRQGAISCAYESLQPLEKKVIAVFLGHERDARVLHIIVRDELLDVICSEEYAFSVDETVSDQELLKKAREWYEKWECVKWHFVYEGTGSDRKLVLNEKAWKAGTKLDPETGNILSDSELQKYEKKEKEIIQFLNSLKDDKK